MDFTACYGASEGNPPVLQPDSWMRHLALSCLYEQQTPQDARMKNAMTYKGYKASMAFDVEDKIIVGRVEGIDDIIAFHGESIADFEANFQAVVDDYIAACAALGGEPEKPVNGRLMLRIAPEVHAAAIKAAARSGVSLSKWAEKALGEATRS